VDFHRYVHRSGLDADFHADCVLGEDSERELGVSAVVEQNADLPPVAADAERPAGSPADRFLPQFIPIAEDNTGAVLVVDTSSGELSGCVIEFSRGSEALWPSLGALVSDVISIGPGSGRVLRGHE